VKNVIGWVKKNLIIVISVVLILVFLPVGWVFSSKWNGQVKTAATQAFTSTQSELQRAGSVNYALPAVLEGEESVSERRPPNRAVTEFFAEQRATRLEQVANVVERGTEFNRRDHGELVPGLLPQAANNNALRLLGLEMAEQIAGTRDASGNVIRPSVYQQLMRRLNAGGPTDPAELGATLAEFANREQERYASGSTDGRLTDAQSQQLGSDLVRRRLQEYAGRAKALAFYATPEVLHGANAAMGGRMGSTGWSTIPSVPPSQSEITEADAFVWLWDYWIVTDVLEAVAMANSDRLSGAMPIPEAPVKRVERLRISGIDLPAPAAAGADTTSDPYGGSGRSVMPGGSGSGDAAGAVPATHTGRASEGAYDVRMVELTVVADSQRLPALFEALGRVNYMTVVGVELTPVDVWADLEQGYFYGDDHVVRATVTIETVWLRSWTLPLMPDRVRQAVGAPLAASEAQPGDGYDDEEP
jgi:hypothetical protein